MPADADELAPALEVGLRPLVGVVAVDEQHFDRALGRVGGARVGDDQMHLVREPVALECGAQLCIQLLARHVGAQRDVEVV